MGSVVIALCLIAIASVAASFIARERIEPLTRRLALKEEELKVELAFHRATMDTIPSPIMLKDADARSYDCNPTCGEAFGFDIAKLKGRTLLDIDFYPQEVRERMYADDEEMRAPPGKVVHDETRLEFADGEIDDLLYWKTAFVLPDRRLGGLLGVMVDISDIKKCRKAAMEAKEIADAANHAKSSFLEPMSHAIRTPMNAVLGMLKLMRNERDTLRSFYRDWTFRRTKINFNSDCPLRTGRRFPNSFRLE